MRGNEERCIREVGRARPMTRYGLVLRANFPRPSRLAKAFDVRARLCEASRSAKFADRPGIWEG